MLYYAIFVSLLQRKTTGWAVLGDLISHFEAPLPHSALSAHIRQLRELEKRSTNPDLPGGLTKKKNKHRKREFASTKASYQKNTVSRCNVHGVEAYVCMI